MSIFSGPEIANSGLVFHYDMANTQKSWKGEPTTNLAPNMDIVAIQGSPTISFVGIEDGWRKYSINGTWSAGTYPYSVGTQSVSLVGGTTYSTSMFVKTNVPNKFATLFSGMNYVNQPMNNVGTSFSVPQADGSFYVGRTGFQYTSSTSQIGYLLSQPIIGQSFSSASDFIFIRNGQVEAKSYPTPFVNGTRSNTQALLDSTNNNTLTATSLTYASDNTFSFNGTDNIITTPDNSSLSFSDQVFTFDYWVYFNNTSSFNGIVGKGEGSWEYAIYAIGTNGIRFYSWPLSGAGAVYTPPLTTTFLANRWYHHCWTANGSNSYLYVNGTLSGSNSKSVTYSMGNGTSRITIGAAGDSSGLIYLNGKLDNLKIYNRFLTETEVYQNFEAARTRYGI